LPCLTTKGHQIALQLVISYKHIYITHIYNIYIEREIEVISYQYSEILINNIHDIYIYVCVYMHVYIYMCIKYRYTLFHQVFINSTRFCWVAHQQHADGLTVEGQTLAPERGAHPLKSERCLYICCVSGYLLSIYLDYLSIYLPIYRSNYLAI
jgi:hypothetical protein